MSIPVDDGLLPAVATLTAEQLRGGACVWCETPLRPGIDDVDLGARRTTRNGPAWFPRGCRRCCYGREDL
ncbi:hypothetical protein [Streptomyces sp. NRRL F-5630]|uniref:hypothetical protein n=1 Tax=Streptomyces sp. NRRL F-5630 TaxID=1463864 RepID=UPI003EB6B67D